MNSIKKNITTILFFITSLVYVYYKVFFDIDRLLALKILMNSLLVINYFLSTKKIDLLFSAILILELIGGGIFIANDENIVLGMGFFFIINLMLTLIVTKKTELINSKDTLIMTLIVSIIVVTATYFTFLSMGYIKLFIMLFAVVFSLLMSFSFINFKKTPNHYSFLFFLGVFLFLLRYLAGGYVRLVERNNILIIIETISFVLGIFFLTKAMFHDSKQDTKDLT